MASMSESRLQSMGSPIALSSRTDMACPAVGRSEQLIPRLEKDDLSYHSRQLNDMTHEHRTKKSHETGF